MTGTDRELLELAALAAGISFVWLHSGGAREDRKPGVIQPYVRWNPLTDDGDALRLAVKLGLDVFNRPEQWAECGRIGSAGCREKHGTDPYAATRRAIVCAAAEIGKEMK